MDGCYKITGVLGAGGFAVVYQAIQMNLRKPVALKVLTDESRKDPKHTQRFFLEAEAAAALLHPNIVRVQDVGVLETGQPYIVMEPFQGRNLKRALAVEGPLPPERAIPLFIGALDGLAIAHAQGVIHRDLKPSNLILVDAGKPSESLKIIDFGTARLQHAESELTGSGLLGTPAYLAPEYIKSHTVSPAMDVYQMGLVLAETMLGRRLIEAETPYMFLLAHAKGELNLPDALREGPLGEVMLKALHLNPQQRFPDAAAFRDALRGVDLAHLPALPVEYRPFAVAASTFSSTDLSIAAELSMEGLRSSSIKLPAPEPQAEPLPPAPQPSLRWPLVMAAALALLGVGALIVALALGSSSEAPAPQAQAQAPTAPSPPPATAPPAEAISFVLSTDPPGLEVLDADSSVSLGRTPIRLEAAPGQPRYVQFRQDAAVSPLQRVAPAAGAERVELDLKDWLATLAGDFPMEDAAPASAPPRAASAPGARWTPRGAPAGAAAPASAASAAPATAASRPRLGTIDDDRPQLGTVDDPARPKTGTLD